jgi:hypothetical protein
LSITFYTAILALVEPSSRVPIRDVAVRADASIALAASVMSRQYGVTADAPTRAAPVIDDLGREPSHVTPSPGHRRTNVLGIRAADREPFSTGRPEGAVDAMPRCAPSEPISSMTDGPR